VTKIYRKLPVQEVNRLIDWAESNKVDWDVWDPYRMLTDPNLIEAEVWLDRWPSIGELP
jgi:hypothetical protein